MSCDICLSEGEHDVAVHAEFERKVREAGIGAVVTDARQYRVWYLPAVVAAEVWFCQGCFKPHHGRWWYAFASRMCTSCYLAFVMPAGSA